MASERDQPNRAELQDLLVRELSIVHQLAHTRLNRALRPLGITFTHAGVLFHLGSVGAQASVSQIAAAMEVNQPAVSKTLKALVDLGAVVIETPSDDGRRRIVRLTPAGGELITKARTAMHPDATLALTGLADGQLTHLVELLDQIRENLEHPPG